MGKRIRDKQPQVAVENNSVTSTSTSTSSSNGHQGKSSWGIFQIIKYNNWQNHVKKKLTHKRPGATCKNSTKADIPRTLDASRVDNMQQHYEPESKLRIVEEMSEQSTPRAKQSVKARLKALISEEIVLRKKSRHKRSSTCPVKPNQPISNIPDDVDLMNGSLSYENDQKTKCETPSKMLNEICVECGTRFSTDLKSNNNHHVHKLYKQSSSSSSSDQYHALLKETTTILSSPSPSLGGYGEKSIQARLLTTDVSPLLFKDFLDTLDIINVNKDMLLKFLQHPRSPLPAYEIHNQQATSNIRKTKLNKSISFPVPTSSSPSSLSSPPPPPGVSIQNKSNMVDGRFKAKVGERQLQTQSSSGKNCHQSELLDSSYKVDSKLPSVPIPHVQNPRAIKRFKDLRQKVRHVIEESKNEKKRIAMDAIFHKIPPGNKLPNDLKKNVFDKSSKDPTIMGEGNTNIASTRSRQVSPIRNLSLNESVWRYSQLYETCFNKEAKYPKSERLKLKIGERDSTSLTTSKSLQRFLSLPNLKNYFSQSNDASILFPPPIVPSRKFGQKTRTLSTVDDQINFDHCDLSHQDLESASKSILEESVKKSDIGSESNEDKEYINQNRSIQFDDNDYGKLTDTDNNEESSQQSREFNPLEVEEKSYSSFDSSSFLEDTIDFDEQLSLSEDLEEKPRLIDGLDHTDEQLQPIIVGYHEEERGEEDVLKFGVEVDAKLGVEFNYVRDVLEISGFTGHDSLGMWYSADQPIDPIVYEEMEKCLLFDTECSNIIGNEEYGHDCNHLLLFDLVNEVLVEIFGRSCSYYPKPLSSLAHVHPMPKGEHVTPEVWTLISSYLRSNSNLLYPSLDYYVSQDLARSDGWMNLQFDSECVGLELDDLIFDDLLEEIICT